VDVLLHDACAFLGLGALFNDGLNVFIFSGALYSNSSIRILSRLQDPNVVTVVLSSVVIVRLELREERIVKAILDVECHWQG
jgi:hypothetical protein